MLTSFSFTSSSSKAYVEVQLARLMSGVIGGFSSLRFTFFQSIDAKNGWDWGKKKRCPKTKRQNEKSEGRRGEGRMEGKWWSGWRHWRLQFPSIHLLPIDRCEKWMRLKKEKEWKAKNQKTNSRAKNAGRVRWFQFTSIHLPALTVRLPPFRSVCRPLSPSLAQSSLSLVPWLQPILFQWAVRIQSCSAAPRLVEIEEDFEPLSKEARRRRRNNRNTNTRRWGANNKQECQMSEEQHHQQDDHPIEKATDPVLGLSGEPLSKEKVMNNNKKRKGKGVNKKVRKSSSTLCAPVLGLPD